METKFRPLPLSILDLFAIFLPGIIWLTLIVTTIQLCYKLTVTPLNSLQAIISFVNNLNSVTFSYFSIILVSLLIGYIFKPLAMRSAQWFSRYLFKTHKKTKQFKLRDLKFPFTQLLKKEPYYNTVLEIVKEKTGCSPESLPANQAFTAAKRYLRLIAPSLWEECERMEAEVRMSGTILIAAVYSSILSLIAVIMHYFNVVQYKTQAEVWIWFILSILISIVLAEGFNNLRYREVIYTYMNTLITYRYEKDAISHANHLPRK